MKYVSNARIVLRRVGDFFFLVDPLLSYNDDNENLLQIDEMGALIWSCLEHLTDIDKICARIELFITDQITDELKLQIRQDVLEYLILLKKHEYVLEV